MSLQLLRIREKFLALSGRHMVHSFWFVEYPFSNENARCQVSKGQIKKLPHTRISAGLLFEHSWTLSFEHERISIWYQYVH